MSTTDRLIKDIVRERRFHFRLFIEGIVVGIFSGGVIALFRYILTASEVYRPEIYKTVATAFYEGKYSEPLAYAASFILIALLLARLLKNEPMCSGSGIPQLKGVLMGKMNMKWASVLFSKLIGGILAIGAGLSLGREGPSVQIGACVGQGVSRSAVRTRYEERILMTAGAGAGLAAAFNAPLAGVIFCLEELQKTFSPVVLMASITASVTATTVSQLIFGGLPVFHFDELAVFPLSLYGILIVFGIYIGLLGRVFNKTLIFSLDTYDRLKLRNEVKIFVPLAMAGLLGFILPDILGGGGTMVNALASHQYSLIFLGILFLGKFLYTAISFGSGVPGGIFLPMLVLGACGGGIFSSMLLSQGLLPKPYVGDLIVFGMAAYFSAVVKSPVTASVLIMEMTGSFQHLLPLICVSMTAYLVADLTGGKPVYEELLARSLKIKEKMGEGVSGRRVALELVVASGSAADKLLLRDLVLPPQTTIVDIKRGLQRISPRDDTRLYAGDYIYLLTNDTDSSALKKLLGEGKIPER
ncbi:MAG: ClC family H(+)/Cl(-) exchange transporter [Anaerovibrio sp.]|nr:ClC family H(+)/Cl(-) exchange transporter [Anaerovibrio sp.]